MNRGTATFRAPGGRVWRRIGFGAGCVLFPWLPAPGQPSAGPEVVALQRRAESGEPEAVNALANAYAYGQGVAQNYDEAIRLYRIASDRGLAAAQFNLGLLYELGRGVAPDAAEAFRLYLRAAEQGLAAAQFNVGNMYANGIGTAPDLFEAALWFRQAAEQRLPEAQYNLALAYENGRGVARDEAAARRWYRTAAEQGNIRAFFNLALMVETGRGGEPDPAAALTLYRAAATQNFAPAQHRLGLMLAGGRGVAANPVEAYKWLALAAEQGQDTAARDAVAGRLSEKDLGDANLSLARARSLVLGGAAGEPDVSEPRSPAAELARARSGRTGDPAEEQGPAQMPGSGPAVPLAGPEAPRPEKSLPELAAGDARIAKLIQENQRLAQEVGRANLRLVHVNRQLRNFQAREGSLAREPAEADAAAEEKRKLAELTARVEVLRRTVQRLAEENRWHHARAAEAERARAAQPTR